VDWQRDKIRAVLDTNVLLGSYRLPLLRMAAADLFTIVWSDYIAAEMERKFVEIGWSENQSTKLRALIDRVAIIVDHTKITAGNYDEWLLDLDDHPIMATAIAGEVDYLVTANTKDFPPKKRFAGITIITPDAFEQLFIS